MDEAGLFVEELTNKLDGLAEGFKSDLVVVLSLLVFLILFSSGFNFSSLGSLILSDIGFQSGDGLSQSFSSGVENVIELGGGRLNILLGNTDLRLELFNSVIMVNGLSSEQVFLVL